MICLKYIIININPGINLLCLLAPSFATTCISYLTFRVPISYLIPGKLNTSNVYSCNAIHHKKELGDFQYITCKQLVNQSHVSENFYHYVIPKTYSCNPNNI